MVRSTDITDGLTAPTLNGEDITIELSPDRINGMSNILDVDIEADNGRSFLNVQTIQFCFMAQTTDTLYYLPGIIHIVDTVLTPTSVSSNIVKIASGDDRFSTLVDMVTAAGLVGALSGNGPFTVLGKSTYMSLRILRI